MRKKNSRSKAVAWGGATSLLAATMMAILSATAKPVNAAALCGSGGAFTTSAPTCTYTKVGTDTFTVPDGVTEATFDLFGAEGGSAAGFVAPNPPNDGAPGGLGGETRATLAVSPGQTLQITVGTAGINGSSQHGVFAQPGGFGHGTGGFGGHGGGGSGGGGTDVRVGAFGATDRVLIAGGGGGAGNGGPLLHGGNGGGLAGESGGQGGGPAGSGVAGSGATQTADGAGAPHPAGPGGPGAPAVHTSTPRSEGPTPAVVAPAATVAAAAMAVAAVAVATSVAAAAPVAVTQAISTEPAEAAEAALRPPPRPGSPLPAVSTTATAR